MFCYILVIGLVLAPFNLAEEATKGNKTEVVCEKPEVKEAGDTFFNCFNQNVEHSINKNSSECGDLVRNILHYVQVTNKSCHNDTKSGPQYERDAIEFIKLVQFSIRNSEFQDFVNNSGVECIAAVKSKISACVNQYIVAEPDQANRYRKYNNLWKMTSLTINENTCKMTNAIKDCTQKAMRDSSSIRYCKYDNNNILYVGSLFEYMLGRCSRLVPSWNEWDPPKPKNPFMKIDRGMRTTHALLGVMLALAILAIFYVCVRDCRAPRGQWKTINERISMSIMNRRRSLVTNEAGQGTL